MASELEKHKKQLMQHCRICANKTSSLHLRPFPDTTQISTILKVVYKIDLAKDDPAVHPTLVCNSCNGKFHRFIVGSEEEEDSEGILPKLVEIPSHHSNCEVCAVKRGKPKKRKLSPLRVNTAFLKPKQPRVPDAVKQLEFDHREQPRHPNFNVNSLPVKQFTEAMQQVATIFVCVVCGNVPVRPVQPSSASNCRHIFCKECCEDWLAMQYLLCPCCQETIESPKQVEGITGDIHKNMVVRCKYEGAGCTEHVKLFSIDAHISTCEYSNKPVQKIWARTPYKFLREVTDEDHLKKRIEDVLPNIEEFCLLQGEEECDVFFCLLFLHLKKIGDARWSTIRKLWDEEKQGTLTVDECLALRVGSLQSKGKYREQYDFFDKCGVNVLQHPNKLTSHETTYMPGTARYKLESVDGTDDLHHTPVKTFVQHIPIGDESIETIQPIDIMDSYRSTDDRAKPNCKGVRWAYADALAKTLEELNEEIESGLRKAKIDPTDKDVIFRVTVKDGADGMGSVSQYKEKSESLLPDNAFRYSFAIVKIVAESRDKTATVYRSRNPNSVKVNRPLLESIADENSVATISLIMSPIECERQRLANSFMKVCIGNGQYRRFQFQFYFSMIDEKLDRAESGLMGSGSNYMCTLCTVSSQDEARTKLGEFEINRTHKQAEDVGRYLIDNPDKLSEKNLKAISKGINAVPLIKADAREKGIDATHADINLGSFFYKLLVREIAGLRTWDASEAVKPTLLDASARFDRHMRRYLGLYPSMMMPGNYARMMFKEENVDIVLDLIPNEYRRRQLREVLKKFRVVRKLYRALTPMKDYPEEVRSLKDEAVAMGRILRDEFGYANWPNYLHKVIEHSQELIEDPNGPQTIGGMSGEGNEAGNKIFRTIREYVAYRGSTDKSLMDILKVHWLYSSPTLGRIGSIQRSRNNCSVCHKPGHKMPTCPEAKKVQPSSFVITSNISLNKFQHLSHNVRSFKN
ncbi:V(D)J recombination-activating protein 1-like [Amphiura filiformis]|uniref:V(D)J recombination-activating protein 1-like n=1 Tax=Amphiura filiformis TaxID=82378 RepID=UPI003B225CA9